ncbi:transposase [Nonomuraea dietziae]|uniref:transposase n=1 Tax=Nonomuraea dietziae TaxID=65515 RepID=UPI001C84BEBE
MAVHGVGPDTAGQLLVTAGENHDRLTSEAAFAMLCGVAPIPASSGKTSRRLNRGGDRQANAALYRIALVRLRWDPRTRTYMERRTKDGLSKKEIISPMSAAVRRSEYVSGFRNHQRDCGERIDAQLLARRRHAAEAEEEGPSPTPGASLDGSRSAGTGPGRTGSPHSGRHRRHRRAPSGGLGSTGRV